MALRILPMSAAEAARGAAPVGESGFGALLTDLGNLPLSKVGVCADIVGLTSHVEVTQEFVNTCEEPVEARYIFPLPDRSAVIGMRMTVADRVIEARLDERGAARETYDEAIAAGQRASIAQEERPDVFTLHVGNILPGERVSVTLKLAGVLATEDGEATFRFPLVVAPRYVPGVAVPAGDGAAGDGAAGGGIGEGGGDAGPAEVSRISPPVLLPGFPNPVVLTIEVGIDPAGLTLGAVRSSLHAVSSRKGRIRIKPGERIDRDFVLRIPFEAPEQVAGLTVVHDPPERAGAPDQGRAGAPDQGRADGSETAEGTFQLTVIPQDAQAPRHPRDVVLLLDRSGSMEGWKMVAARRAAARIIDTLTDTDRFAVLAFADAVESPRGLPAGLVSAVDRHRYRAVEHLARMDARGGTELLEPLRLASRLLFTVEEGAGSAARDRVVVLVTDGQVGNEDEILRESDVLSRARVHTVGIDRAVNAGFLGRLAAFGGGRCELVESEDRLDDAMDNIHRRIGSPLVTGISLEVEGGTLQHGTRTPARLPDLFSGVPYVVRGRYTGQPPASMTVRGRTPAGMDWSATGTATTGDCPALAAVWARAVLRDLEDEYVVFRGPAGEAAQAAFDEREQRMVALSLRFGVLCRFTAFVAVDPRVVTGGGELRRITQPVEPSSGWDMLARRPEAPLRSSTVPAPTPLAAPAMRLAAHATSQTMSTTMGFTGPAGGSAPSLLPRGERDNLVELRAHAANELRRLREYATGPWYVRRDVLADLGTRLAAVTSGGGPEGAPLHALALELSMERLDYATCGEHEVERLWEETMLALEAFAAGPAAGPTGRDDATASGRAAGGGRSATRRPFWKR